LAVGGYDGRAELATSESLDGGGGGWLQRAAMGVARRGAACCALEDDVYVMGGTAAELEVRGGEGGGCTSDFQMDVVEKYSAAGDAWERVGGLKMKRHSLAACALMGRVFAVGGVDGSKSLSIVEIFDPSLNLWSIGPSLTSAHPPSPP
jgi:hypothetical protein